VNMAMKTQLLRVCEFESSSKWNLLYRGSVHGFGASDFHANCDFYPKTLTIIKETSGNIFGGYTTVSWDLSSEFKQIIRRLSLAWLTQ
jgi:hypothetical protein